MPGSPYVVVLAGGEGTRLASLTRALYGTDLPKQFAILAGERSLLQQTIERARLLTTFDRILVVVTRHREAIAREQLAPYPSVELVVQPLNLDTGPGLLLPLIHIHVRKPHPQARVVFLPSDHYVSDSEPLVEALRTTELDEVRDHVALIGVTPTEAEVEYGWILRGRRIGHTGAFAIARFHEKPLQADADQLFRGDGLWNTFILAGPLHVFGELYQHHLPDHVEVLERFAVAIGTPAEATELDGAYRAMPAANFSRDILAHARSLVVVPVTGTGWSDWGSPKRVFASLAGTPSHDRLVERIRGNAA